jgi:hypothetical protein
MLQNDRNLLLVPMIGGATDSTRAVVVPSSMGTGAADASTGSLATLMGGRDGRSCLPADNPPVAAE